LTFFARYDIALILDLCRRIGAPADDERVAALLDFVRDCRGPYGLWNYEPRPQAGRWVTFDILRSLTSLEAAEGRSSDWLSLEPRTPFAAYPVRRRRF
jgi:hypothetical protein